MLARVTRAKIDREKIDDAIKKVDSEIIPDIQDDPGLVGFYVYGNRISGDTMVVTIWDDDKSEEASRTKVAQRFGILGEYLTSPPDISHTYEVMNSYVPAKAPSV